MYGPDVVILLMYGSHDMRHTGFRTLTVVNGTPGSRRHTTSSPSDIKSYPQTVYSSVMSLKTLLMTFPL